MSGEYGPTGGAVVSEDIREWRQNYYVIPENYLLQDGGNTIACVVDTIDEFVASLDSGRSYITDQDYSEHPAYYMIGEEYDNELDEDDDNKQIMDTIIEVKSTLHKNSDFQREQYVIKLGHYAMIQGEHQVLYGAIYRITRYVGDFFEMHIIKDEAESIQPAEHLDEPEANDLNPTEDVWKPCCEYEVERLQEEIERLGKLHSAVQRQQAGSSNHN
jgi:hypothetical protein